LTVRDMCSVGSDFTGMVPAAEKLIANCPQVNF
jgi:hypothetical protein